ncbi:MAG: porin family protein, partial [Prevotella sp.]|nr:porin family protein [Prevotella sp.]
FAKSNESVTGFTMPIGVGVKYKLKQRLNLTAEWVMHFSGTDKLDGVKDPYGIKSSGMFKNTDCFSTIQVSITYEFMERCRTCHNDRE